MKIVSEIGEWLKVNAEAIYSSQPWKIFGEGPSTHGSEKGKFGGQADFQKAPFTADDIRFTQSKDGKRLYAILLAVPNGPVTIKSLVAGNEKITAVNLLGSNDKLQWAQTSNGLVIQPVSRSGQASMR